MNVRSKSKVWLCLALATAAIGLVTSGASAEPPPPSSPPAQPGSHERIPFLPRRGPPPSDDHLVPHALPSEITSPQASAATTTSAATTASTLTTSFPGLNIFDTLGGEPPDTQVAKSFNYVVEAVNVHLRLFNTSGGEIETRSLSDFFCNGTTDCQSDAGFTDPRAYFDQNASNKRIYVIALEYRGVRDSDPTNNYSRIHLAVSRSNDPSTLGSSGWCRYWFDSLRDRGTSSESFSDYPALGAGADALLISTNAFTFAPQDPADPDSLKFTYSYIYSLKKLVAANNAAPSSCPSFTSLSVRFFRASQTLGDPTTDTLQPAQHYTSPSSFVGATNPAYLVSTRGDAPTKQYKVWRVVNVASGSPRLDGPVVVSGSFLYNQPVDTPIGSQSGFTYFFDHKNQDTRMLQAVGRGNLIWATHTTSCQVGADGSPLENCAIVLRLGVGQSSSTGAMLAWVSQQIVQGVGEGTFLYLPGISVNSAQTIGLVAQYSTATQPVSAVWGTKSAFYSSFPSFFYLAQGECVYDGTRLGDYSGAQLDPSDSSSFWVAAERAASFTFGLECLWETWIGKIKP